jgi:gas vesicle protein
MARENNSGVSFLIGLFTGGAIGAVLALMYAPKSGKEFREDLRNTTDEYLDEADKYISDARDRAKDMINEGKQRSDKIVNDARSKSDEILKNAEKILSEAKSKVNSTINDKKANLDVEKENLKTAFKAGVDAYKESKKNG